jgi:hypothetical protein
MSHREFEDYLRWSPRRDSMALYDRRATKYLASMLGLFRKRDMQSYLASKRENGFLTIHYGLFDDYPSPFSESVVPHALSLRIQQIVLAR